MTIIGYTYRAENYTPDAIMDALATGEGEDFDGWALAPGADYVTTEDNLSEIAYAFGINRADEYTFDSDYFPKVILCTMDVDPTEFVGS